MGLLTWLWFFPLLAGGVIGLAGGKDARRARNLAMIAAAAELAAWTALSFLADAQGLGAVSESSGELVFGIRYSLALDGLSLALCDLTALLTFLCFLASWRQGATRFYWVCFLFLEAALMGVFLARDLWVFYVFWEAVLIPMFFIIGLWGSEGRRHAAVKFFLFTFFGSVLLLFGFLLLAAEHHAATGVLSWEMGDLRGPAAGWKAAVIFSCLLIGFGVKVPIVPLHTWLPDAHTEAPAAGSVMLAGVLLKMGVYGIIRVLIGALPELSWRWLPGLGLIAAVNVIYGAFCAMAQSDLKRLIAYSSVAHLGFCLLGVFSRTPEGLAGGSLQMINHGLITGALFLMVGFLYERSHKRAISDFGALAFRAPWLSFFFTVAVMASIGLPGLNGFVGEFMALAGAARVLPILAIAGALGVVLSAAYALPAYQTVFWGEPGPDSASPLVTDLELREKAVLWILILMMLAIGVFPRPWLRVFETALREFAA